MNPMLGIGSGLDLSTMMDGLVRVASEPKVQQLGQKEVETKDAISGLGTLKSLLSDFQTAADALKNSDLYNNRKASIDQPADGDVISVSADDDAVLGSYAISVEQVAYGTDGYTSQINADHEAALGKTDTLTFSVPDGSESSFDIAVDATMSLDDIRDAINDADDNFGVAVNVVDGRLVYESSITGAAVDKELQITSANADTDFDISVYNQNAQQAQIKVDGIDIYSDSNTFDSAVSGISIEALRADPGEDASVSIALDSASVKSKIQSFANTYNELREGMNELKGSYDEDAEQFVYGQLSGDPIIRNVEAVLGGLLTQQVDGAPGNYDTLYSVGLDIESDGTLSVDSDRLSDALSTGFDELDDLFSGTNGIATQVSDQLESFLSYTGVIQGKEDSYNDILSDLEDQYEAHTLYIEGYQATLMKQFTALDSTMARLQATMSQVGPQLAALGNVSYSSGS